MAHERHDPTVTTDPWSLVAEGWVCTEVVGYVADDVDEVAALRRHHSAAVAAQVARFGRLAGAADRRAVRPAAALLARVATSLRTRRART
jgi:hypothetical protein